MIAFLVTLSLLVQADSVPITGPNFRVISGVDPSTARRIEVEAEKLRKSLALEWLGKEIPSWDKPCPIAVKIIQGTGGQTNFTFDNGKVFGWDMHVKGTLNRVLAGSLPHEILHTVLATEFLRPLPRWFDEGVATMAEDDVEKDRQWGFMVELLNNPNRIGSLRTVFRMKDYPSDTFPLYTQGYWVCRYLVMKKDKPTLIAFLKTALKTGLYDPALQEHYGIETVEELEKNWLDWLKTSPNSVVVAKDDRISDKLKGHEIWYFTADWCDPCKKMKPIINGLYAEGYPFRTVDVDSRPDQARKYGVRAIPALVLHHPDGKWDKLVGLQSRMQIIRWLTGCLPVRDKPRKTVPITAIPPGTGTNPQPTQPIPSTPHPHPPQEHEHVHIHEDLVKQVKELTLKVQTGQQVIVSLNNKIEALEKGGSEVDLSKVEKRIAELKEELSTIGKKRVVLSIYYGSQFLGDSLSGPIGDPGNPYVALDLKEVEEQKAASDSSN